MRTLDEVIKALELCSTEDNPCDKCPYTEFDKNGVWACSMCGDFAEDALHYLKKYRENLEARNDQVKRYQKAAKDCEAILTDYVALKQYWAEQQVNNPLTWDELKEMEGKPVWVEYIKGGKCIDAEWIVIKKVKETYIENSSGRFQADSLGWSWQAYRKERNETGD